MEKQNGNDKKLYRNNATSVFLILELTISRVHRTSPNPHPQPYGPICIKTDLHIHSSLSECMPPPATQIYTQKKTNNNIIMGWFILSYFDFPKYMRYYVEDVKWDLRCIGYHM